MLEATDILESDNDKKVCTFSNKQPEYSHCIHKVYCKLVIYMVGANYSAWGKMELSDEFYFSSINFVSTDNF